MGSKKVSAIEDITEKIIDYRGKTPLKSDNGIRLVTAKVIKNGFIQEERAEYISEDTYTSWMRRGYPQQHDIVITTEAPLGEVAQLRTTEKVALAQRVILLRAKQDVMDQQYFYQALKSPIVQANLQQRATGTTVFGIKQSELRKVEVPYFPLPTQRKIATILSAYDDLIENNLRRIKTLEEMAQNLYREWFVNFRFPGHEHTRFVDSPLGRIPEGWEPVPVKDFLQKNIGGSWGKDEPSEENSCEVRVIRGTDFKKIRSGLFDDVPTRFIKPKELANRLIQPGDLLVENSINASSRCVGTPKFITSGILNMLKLPSICASFCKLYRPFKSEHASLLYLHMNYLLAEGKMNYYQNVAANGIGNFQSQRFLEDEKIVVPADSSTLKFLLNKLSPLLTSNNAERIAILRQTRDLLLPKLISGEVDVSKFDIKVPEEVAS